jgi:environmental stress-induced protein Ves
MPAITLLRAADRIAKPWKNGGGVTHDIAVWPDHAGLDDFDWRVSMAEVATDGPFSLFPGVDRTLAVLSGTMRLTIDGRGVHDFTADGAPLSFPGDIAVFGSPLGGAVTDLNVMVRRDRYKASLRRLETTDSIVVAEDETAILVAMTTLTARFQDRSIGLATLDALRISGPERIAVSGKAFRISIKSVGAASHPEIYSPSAK